MVEDGPKTTWSSSSSNSSKWVSPHSIEWTRLEGGIPRFVSFSSYSASNGEALLYSAVLVITFPMLLGLTAFKWVTEDKTSKLAAAFEGGQSGKRWSKFVFASFDWSVTGKVAVNDQRAHFADQVLNMRAEDEFRQI